MALFTHATWKETKQSIRLQCQWACSDLEEQLAFYQNNLANGMGDGAQAILQYNLSDAAQRLTGYADGGMTFHVQDAAGTAAVSQIAYGYGHEAGVDVGQRWYLQLDEGLDDEGQIQLARWLMDHRSGWGYALYPADPAAGQKSGDGTYAKVTGFQRPGFVAAVQKIVLVHPDGAEETVVETALPGQPDLELDLQFLTMSSALLPDWINGANGPVHMERRLANYRSSQAIAETAAAADEPGNLAGGETCLVTQGPDGTMGLVAGSSSALTAAVERLWPYYLGTLGLILLITLLLSAHLSRTVTGPVESLCRDVSQGRCREDGTIRELNVLASACNAAHAQLSRQMEREREFASAAAHELKTPLAALQAHAEALQEGIVPEKREQYLDVILEESDHMARLTQSMLALYRLDGSCWLSFQSVDLSALLRDVWKPFSLPLERKQIQLQLELQPVQLMGDARYLREAMTNLASNAVRHCFKGKTIRVYLTRQNHWVRIAVENDGPQVSAADLPRLFEPFYRGEGSRSRESGGTGLGLAIVRAVAQAHHGSCTVENLTAGVRFSMTLPLEQKAPQR